MLILGGEPLDSLKRFFSYRMAEQGPLLHFIPAKEIRTRSEVRPKSKKYVNGQNNEEPTVACSKSLPPPRRAMQQTRPTTAYGASHKPALPFSARSD